MSTPAIPKNSLVLVTGANGYIASHVADQFLTAGFRVRGTVRSINKAESLSALFDKKYGAGKFEFVVVEDMSHPGAFDDAVKGVSAVAHVASILTFNADPNKVIPEVLAGINGILKSAAAELSVKRFVYTSSSTAATAPIPNKVYTVTSETWNTDTIEQAWAPPPYHDERKWAVYGASKTQAEQALWKFVKEEKPNFVVNSILPNANFGKILWKGQPASTGDWVVTMNSGNAGPLGSIPPQFFVDVQDNARLHVAATIDPEVANQRIFAYAAPFTYNDIVRILKKLRPEGKFPELMETEDKELSLVPETKKTEDILKRLKGSSWTSLEESVANTIEGLDGSEKSKDNRF